MLRSGLVVSVVLLGAVDVRADAQRPKVAVALTGARASLSVGGAWLPKGTTSRKRLEIVDDKSKRPRFVEYVEGVKLFLYADAAALATCVLPGTEIDGVVLDRSACLDEKVKAGAPIRLRWIGGGGSVEVSGKVAASKLTKLVNVDVAESVEPDWDVSLPKSYRVLAAPGGKPVVSGSGPIQGAQKLAHTGDYTLVRTQLGVVGWVLTRELGAGVAKREMGIAGGALGSSGLSVGTKLFDAINGKQVGEVEWRFDARVIEEKDGWFRFDVPTQFGVVPVWAPSPKAKTITKAPATEDLMNLNPGKLRALQITGSIDIKPDDATKAAIAGAKKTVIVASAKLCVDTQGRVSDVQITRSSGFPKYDADIEGAIRTWTFRPYLVDGKAAKVCAPAAVVYRATP